MDSKIGHPWTVTDFLSGEIELVRFAKADALAPANGQQFGGWLHSRPLSCFAELSFGDLIHHLKIFGKPHKIVVRSCEVLSPQEYVFAPEDVVSVEELAVPPHLLMLAGLA